LVEASLLPSNEPGCIQAWQLCLRSEKRTQGVQASSHFPNEQGEAHHLSFCHESAGISVIGGEVQSNLRKVRLRDQAVPTQIGMTYLICWLFRFL
jgi:hypothetical protein